MLCYITLYYIIFYYVITLYHIRPDLGRARRGSPGRDRLAQGGPQDPRQPGTNNDTYNSSDNDDDDDNDTTFSNMYNYTK